MRSPYKFASVRCAARCITNCSASKLRDGKQAMLYKYDQLNRITKSRSLAFGSNAYAARSGDQKYDEDYSYDANGNILTLNRKDDKAALAVISDKVNLYGHNNILDSARATAVSASDYYPFGLPMKGRQFNEKNFRYGFNGKEKDNSFSSATSYDYGFRIYDPSKGRFLSVDALAHKLPSFSSYVFCYNNPVRYIDTDGRMAVGFDTGLYNTDGKKIGTDGVDNGVKMVVTDKKEARQVSKVKGNVDLSTVQSGVTLPSDATLQESLNVLDRTISNGGLREESSIVMNDGTVIQGQTGSMPTIVNGVQIATATLPNLPAGTTLADTEATIHSHPTTVQQVGNTIYPQEANTPSPTDKGTFSQYNRNIIVGPLGTVNTNQVTTNPNGTLNVPNRPNGAVIYDRNTMPLELKRKAIENILKN